MPSIFKALASILAWALFIGAWIIGLMRMAQGIIGGQMWTLAAEGQEWMFAYIALAIVCATLSVVVMRLRKSLD